MAGMFELNYESLEASAMTRLLRRGRVEETCTHYAHDPHDDKTIMSQPEDAAEDSASTDPGRSQ